MKNMEKLGYLVNIIIFLMIPMHIAPSPISIDEYLVKMASRVLRLHEVDFSEVDYEKDDMSRDNYGYKFNEQKVSVQINAALGLITIQVGAPLSKKWFTSGEQTRIEEYFNEDHKVSFFRLRHQAMQTMSTIWEHKWDNKKQHSNEEFHMWSELKLTLSDYEDMKAKLNS